MDLQMPVMDGLEAAGEIRALPAPLRDVPIVALTAQALPTDQARTSRAGMNYHLVKPIKAANSKTCWRKWQHPCRAPAPMLPPRPTPPFRARWSMMRRWRIYAG